jgi:hypothetical protein
MKRGKELKIIDVSDNYTITFGTVDNKTPKSVYIHISSWGLPVSFSDNENYSRIINNLCKVVKQGLYNIIDKDFYNKDRTIVDLDMRESGIKQHKRSYMCTEVTLYQENEYPINTEPLYDYSHELIKEIIKMLDENKDFVFHKTKN